MKVSVDADLCTGHGRCYALAPDLFAPDEFGHCEILTEVVERPEQIAQARLGAENCPERAITIAD